MVDTEFDVKRRFFVCVDWTQIFKIDKSASSMDLKLHVQVGHSSKLVIANQKWT